MTRQEQLVVVLADRQEHVVVETGNHADANVCRHHADHGVRLAVERDRLPDDARVGGEATTPESLAEQHDRRSAGLVLRRRERPSEKRLHSEDRKVTRRYTSADQTFRLRLAGEREHLDQPGRDLLERPRARAHVEEVRIRNGVLARFRRRAVNGNQAVGLGVGERIQQCGVDDAEDRRVGADPKRQAQHGGCGERWMLNQHPRGVPSVLTHLFKKSGQHTITSSARGASTRRTSFARR